MNRERNATIGSRVIAIAISLALLTAYAVGYRARGDQWYHQDILEYRGYQTGFETAMFVPAAKVESLFRGYEIQIMRAAEIEDLAEEYIELKRAD